MKYNSSANVIHQNFSLDVKLLHCGIEASPNHSFNSKIFDRHVLNYIIEGDGITEINGKKFSFKAGDILYHPAKVPIHQKHVNKPYKYYYIAFYGGQSQSLLQKANLSLSNIVSTPNSPEFYKNCFKKMFKLFKNDSFLSIFQANIVFAQLLYKLFEQYPENKTIFNSNRLILIEQAREYIHNNYNSKITVTDICKNLYTNRSYLTTQFKKTCGVSLKKYIINYRIDKAQVLILNTNLPITQVATNVGFTDYACFYRDFLSKVGISPQQYRIENKKSVSYKGDSE